MSVCPVCGGVAVLARPYLRGDGSLYLGIDEHLCADCGASWTLDPDDGSPVPVYEPGDVA